MENDKQNDWIEDFNSLFGEVERSENIRVFIEDLLEEQAREIVEEMWRDLKSDVNNAHNASVHATGHGMKEIDNIWNNWKDRYLKDKLSKSK